AITCRSVSDLVEQLAVPRVVWLMVPAAIVDGMIDELAPMLQPGDTLIDGGNSHYVDDIRRARALESRGILYVDVGPSGGAWGLDWRYCLMTGGSHDAVGRLNPIFRTLAAGRGSLAPTPQVRGGSTAEDGYLHCGPAGAGHFVKMVHNGIEYGLMAAYGEGLN